MPEIEVSHLTKDYGSGRGVFDVSLEVERGECFGFLGPNGAGKTTTIRHLMGFIKPDAGSTSILGMDSWRDSTRIMNHVSYVPGEIAFPSLPTGTAFLKSQAEFLGVTDLTYLNHVVKLLQLDPSANLKRMSKGMKQKTAIAAALMGDKEILVLDEPTTGLDPLMRDTFLDLVRAEKEKGRTVFMSSHIFEEIEEVCDRVAMIKDGRIIKVLDLRELRHGNRKTFRIAFASPEDAVRFAGAWEPTGAVDEAAATVAVEVPASELERLLHALRVYDVRGLREQHFTLEQHFKNVYLKGEN